MTMRNYLNFQEKPLLFSFTDKTKNTFHKYRIETLSMSKNKQTAWHPAALHPCLNCRLNRRIIYVTVSCSTITVIKCRAALKTLQAFPFFKPTCLCREPKIDYECNSFRNFLFDHPCNFTQRKGKDVVLSGIIIGPVGNKSQFKKNGTILRSFHNRLS